MFDKLLSWSYKGFCAIAVVAVLFSALSWVDADHRSGAQRFGDYLSGTKASSLFSAAHADNPGGAPRVQGVNNGFPVAVAPNGSQTATAGSQSTLGTGSNTLVFTATAGICSVTVINEDSTNTVRCGQTTGSVTTTTGLPLLPYVSATFGPYYGGNVYCRGAAGTPIVDVQPTSCQ